MNTMDLNVEISRLVNYGEARGLIAPEDKVWAANCLLGHFSERGDFIYHADAPVPRYAAEVLDKLCDLMAQQGYIDGDSVVSRDFSDTILMAELTPRPSEVIQRFRALYEESPKAATDYYYALSKATNYIREDRIARDKLWTAPTPYGELVITINLSKPEKDPKAIAAARNQRQHGYPKCALCRENEGYLGSANQAPRGNHRLIPLELCGERWFLQYSPYVYYNEHCIVLSEEHRPMKVSRATFERLLDFVTQLPHYFLGSNADLPIVGGSILSHDHFQGGNFEFPMAKAPLRETLTFPGFEQVRAGIVNWPMSVLRLRSGDKKALVELADKILTAWRGYSDEAADILAFSGDTPHNTITPIARRRGEDFELDLVLRNNRATEEHPLGLFHPHAEYHHIKKENIGLIEVMGLAILPPRLLTETELLTEALSHPEREAELLARPELEKHRAWFPELKAAVAAGQDPETAVKDGIGEIFAKILGNAGVFKDTEAGREAFRRFCGAVR